ERVYVHISHTFDRLNRAEDLAQQSILAEVAPLKAEFVEQRSADPGLDSLPEIIRQHAHAGLEDQQQKLARDQLNGQIRIAKLMEGLAQIAIQVGRFEDRDVSRSRRWHLC